MTSPPLAAQVRQAGQAGTEQVAERLAAVRLVASTAGASRETLSQARRGSCRPRSRPPRRSRRAKRRRGCAKNGPVEHDRVQTGLATARWSRPSRRPDRGWSRRSAAATGRAGRAPGRGREALARAVHGRAVRPQPVRGGRADPAARPELTTIEAYPRGRAERSTCRRLTGAPVAARGPPPAGQRDQAWRRTGLGRRRGIAEPAAAEGRAPSRPLAARDRRARPDRTGGGLREGRRTV